MPTVAHLPHLTELNVHIAEYLVSKASIPLGLFSGLSKLSVHCRDDASFFISQMSTVIAKSPHLKSLNVSYYGDDVPLPALSDLFAKVPTKNPLRLEHLSIKYLDATANQVTVQNLMRLNSFLFCNTNPSITRSVWTSFLVNDVELSDVEIIGHVNEEAISYLSSFSGLRRFAVDIVYVPPDVTMENLLFTVLPKRVNSLQTLELHGVLVVKPPNYVSCNIFSITGSCSQDFDHSGSILNCLKLRDLSVDIDGEESSMPVVSLAKPYY
jgi:hypothetical protein